MHSTQFTKLQLAFLLAIAAICAHPAKAAIARDGHCTASAASCTFTATATGDLKIVWAFNSASGTIPTLPTGWTSIATIHTTGGNGSTNAGAVIGCNDSSSSSDTGSGTWTNATEIVGISYSGTNVGTTANCNTTGVGANATNNAKASTTMSYLTLTLTGASGTSWVAGFGGDKTVATCNPSTMTNVTTAGTGPEATANDTNATVTSWATATCTVTSSVWLTATLEVLVFVPPPCSSTSYGGYKCIQGCVNQSAPTTSPCAFGSNVTSGNDIILSGVVDSVTGSLAVSGCTPVASWTVLDTLGTQNVTSENWKGHVSSSGACTITITCTGGTNDCDSIAVEILGSNGTVDVHGLGSSATSPYTSPNVTTTVNGDLLVGNGWATGPSACTYTAGSGYTKVEATGTSGASCGMIELKVQATAASGTNSSFTSSAADTYNIGIVALEPTGAAGCTGLKLGGLTTVGTGCT